VSVTLADVYAARRAIAPWVARTPLVPSSSLSARCGVAVHLKLETVHETRAFKIRGATTRLLVLAPEARERGVVAVSTGNHGRAVALAARRLGLRAVVCLSELVPANKREAIEALGAELRVVGRTQDEAEEEARRLVAEQGMTLVHPFDDRHVIAGQGTIGLEILEDLPTVGTLLCPLSGGGLLGGIALALKAARPSVRIVGVSMERGAAMVESLRAGRPVPVEEVPTLADSLGGGIGLDNHHTFELIRRLMDDHVLLNETQIADGMRHLYREEGVVAEGGGAVAVAALLHGLAGALLGDTVCIVSGGNVDMARHAALMRE
jgi:threonine dehydratase